MKIGSCATRSANLYRLADCSSPLETQLLLGEDFEILPDNRTRKFLIPRLLINGFLGKPVLTIIKASSKKRKSLFLKQRQPILSAQAVPSSIKKLMSNHWLWIISDWGRVLGLLMTRMAFIKLRRAGSSPKPIPAL